MPTPSEKIRLTKDQRKALSEYRKCAKKEDVYLGSVFVNPIRQREIEAETKAAYDRCKALGMGVDHGL